MTGLWTLRTGRLLLTPVGYGDFETLCALKGDPLVYASMLGGVRSPVLVAADLAQDTIFWAQHGAGMWLVRDSDDQAIGLTGLHERTDGRGIAIRFAFRPETRGRGYAREAAGAALRFAQEYTDIARIIAVARDDNVASRQVLGAIGMQEIGTFQREGDRMLIYEAPKSPNRPR